MVVLLVVICIVVAFVSFCIGFCYGTRLSAKMVCDSYEYALEKSGIPTKTILRIIDLAKEYVNKEKKS